jgi:hypothetical protein
MNRFNSFIMDVELVDLPIAGWSFNWYRGDEITMSRLDRFLLTES